MRAFPFFALLFFIIPLIEIYLLIQVGEVIGAGWTILLVVLTAVLGAFLLRQQGLSTLARFQRNMGQGQLPAQELLEGVLLVVGGALLMTPGFFTDTLGFLCLFPLTRIWIVYGIVKRFAVRVPQPEDINASPDGAPASPQTTTLEGEYTRKDDH